VDHWLTTLTPGLLVALAPAAMTIAFQAIQSGRRQRTAQANERVREVLDFTSQAWAISLMLPFSQAHARVATQMTAPLAILTKQLQPFDLKHMAEHYSAAFTALLRAASQLKATQSEEIAQLVDGVLSATDRLFTVYLIPEDKRSAITQQLAPRPPLDRAEADLAITDHGNAIRSLEAAIKSPAKTRFRRA
jgi:hypothetical protein